MNPNWITAVSAVIAAICAALGLYGVRLVYLQVKEDHRRSRRERSIELMQFWAGDPNQCLPIQAFGRKFLKSLSDEQCRSLWKWETFSVLQNQADALNAFRDSVNHQLGRTEGDRESRSDPLQVSAVECVALRSIAVEMLNRLESVAAAWHHEIADKEIIEKEFKLVYCTSNDSSVLEKFRHASGVYPSIGKLVKQLKKEEENPQPKTGI